MLLPVIILSIIGFGCGVAIFIINRVLPEENPMLQRTGMIAAILPGMNCGACGRPGCFAYAQALAEDPETIIKTPCMTAIQDPVCKSELEAILGVALDLEGMDKKAIVHCVGGSENLSHYKGISTCKAATLLAAGYKQCPFGCLGLGDCERVCPYGAIAVDQEKGVTKVDHSKCIGCGLCISECPHNLIELVSGDTPQYLGCSYVEKKNIPGRERCEAACIKCRKCIKATKETDHPITWDNARNLPIISNTPVPEAIEICPSDVIVAIK